MWRRRSAWFCSLDSPLRSNPLRRKSPASVNCAGPITKRIAPMCQPEDRPPWLVCSKTSRACPNHVSRRCRQPARVTAARRTHLQSRLRHRLRPHKGPRLAVKKSPWSAAPAPGTTALSVVTSSRAAGERWHACTRTARHSPRLAAPRWRRRAPCGRIVSKRTVP